MDIQQLIETITSKGFFPIRIKGSVSEEDSRGFVYDGELPGFLEAAKALNTTVIFVTNRPLHETDFIYEFEEEREDNQTDEPAEIDLATVRPSLNDYKKYIGQDTRFKLSAPMPSGSLDFFMETEWWSGFLTECIKAIGEVLEDRDEAKAQMEEERKVQEEALLSKLGQLINDSKFLSLPTQKAMIVYALDKMPELESLGELRLRNEIQALDARIKAKGLGRKR